MHKQLIQVKCQNCFAPFNAGLKSLRKYCARRTCVHLNYCMSVEQYEKKRFERRGKVQANELRRIEKYLRETGQM